VYFVIVLVNLKHSSLNLGSQSQLSGWCGMAASCSSCAISYLACSECVGSVMALVVQGESRVLGDSSASY